MGNKTRGDANRPMDTCGMCSTHLMYYGSLCVMLGGMLITPFYQPWAVVQMILQVLPIIYLGSHRSLKLLKGPSKNGGVIVDERMSHREALLVPFFGSLALVTLYIAFKYLDRSWLNMLLSAYCAIISAFSLTDIAHDMLGPRWQKMKIFRGDYHIVIPRLPTQTGPTDVKITDGYTVLLLLFAGLGALYIKSKHWLLNNLFASGLSIEAIGLLSAGNFTIATILLSGLFLYDVFWVFATDVMISVAKSFDGPIKMVFPAKLDPFVSSMLGLGDIVVPGVFIALCLRFDYSLHAHKQLQNSCKDNREKSRDADAHEMNNAETSDTRSKKNDNRSTDKNGDDSLDKKTQKASTDKDSTEISMDIHEPFNKFYFSVVTIGYTLGLITTLAAMVLYQHPQPALLYLVPYCIASLFGTGALNGQVKDILRYDEQTETPTSDEPSKKDN